MGFLITFVVFGKDFDETFSEFQEISRNFVTRFSKAKLLFALRKNVTLDVSVSWKATVASALHRAVTVVGFHFSYHDTREYFQ